LNSKAIRTCERAGLILGLVALAVCFATGQSTGTTLGVGVGAALALFNLVAIRKVVTRLVEASIEPEAGDEADGAKVDDTSGEGSGRAVWGVVFILKLGLVLGAVWLSISWLGATTSGLMIGVTAVFATVVVASLAMGTSRPESLDIDRKHNALDTHQETT